MKMKKGFTLVELSIVLVIIGLLVGGILVGQSLVSSAKVSNAIRKMQQLGIAFDMFEDKFRQLPGDSNLFGTPGNNDGVWDDVHMSNCTGSYHDNEIFYVPYHLSISGMVSKDIEPYSGSACGGTHAHDDRSYGTGSSRYSFGLGYENSSLGYEVGVHFTTRGKSTTATLLPGVADADENYAMSSGAPVSDSMSIDVKLDDGDNSTGSYISGVINVGFQACSDFVGDDESQCYFEWRWNK